MISFKKTSLILTLGAMLTLTNAPSISAEDHAQPAPHQEESLTHKLSEWGHKIAHFFKNMFNKAEKEVKTDEKIIEKEAEKIYDSAKKEAEKIGDTIKEEAAKAAEFIEKETKEAKEFLEKKEDHKPVETNSLKTDEKK
jgi:Skp family chaperone for outer membrane proteins